MTSIDLSTYNSLLLDCDGVLLDSNNLKSEAFFELAVAWGREAAEDLLAYHKSHGGISRFKKIAYFMQRWIADPHPNLQSELVRRYGELVREKLLTCAETQGLRDFLLQCKSRNQRLWVVSGGFEDELREVFKKRGLTVYFEDIFGSPSTKHDILKELLSGKTDLGRTLFIGDSLYDWQVARDFGLEFIFMSRYTEMPSWKPFIEENSIRSFETWKEIS